MGGQGTVRKAHLSQAGDRNSLPIRRRRLCAQRSDGTIKRNQCECFSAMPSPDDYCGSVRSLVQRELTKDNSWRSYSTKKSYKAYLNRWVIPRWFAVCPWRRAAVRKSEAFSRFSSIMLAVMNCLTATRSV